MYFVLFDWVDAMNDELLLKDQLLKVMKRNCSTAFSAGLTTFFSLSLILIVDRFLTSQCIDESLSISNVAVQLKKLAYMQVSNGIVQLFQFA